MFDANTDHSIQFQWTEKNTLTLQDVFESLKISRKNSQNECYKKQPEVEEGLFSHIVLFLRSGQLHAAAFRHCFCGSCWFGFLLFFPLLNQVLLWSRHTCDSHKGLRANFGNLRQFVLAAWLCFQKELSAKSDERISALGLVVQRSSKIWWTIMFFLWQKFELQTAISSKKDFPGVEQVAWWAFCSLCHFLKTFAVEQKVVLSNLCCSSARQELWLLIIRIIRVATRSETRNKSN